MYIYIYVCVYIYVYCWLSIECCHRIQFHNNRNQKQIDPKQY
jgi:hypothetical protein